MPLASTVETRLGEFQCYSSSPKDICWKNSSCQEEIALVNFMVIKSQTEGLSAEMLEFLREYSDQFSEILRDSAHLNQVFRLKLRVPDLQPSIYNSISKWGLQTTDRLQTLDMPKGGLLALVLGHILLNGNGQEASIWDMLLKVDVLDELQMINKLFGITRNLLTIYSVHMQFLEYWPVYGINPLKFEFLVSEANRQIPKMGLKFLVEAHDEESWWPESRARSWKLAKPKRSQAAGLEFWSEDTIDKANDLVQSAINVTKELLPIHQHVLLAHTDQKFKYVSSNTLSKATLILDLFYEFSLIEVYTNKPIYLLVQQPELEEEHVMLQSLGRPTQEHVMSILCLILMMGNCVKANVWNLLQRFKHPHSKLMRQQYLESGPPFYSNPVKYRPLWGPQTHLEPTKIKAS
ncbi:LOW QUALITY PROTEIN: melanoma-associated antigen E2 [Erethizon dorsatum]